MNLWVEVDPAALEANARAVMALLGTTPLCAVVKGNGYGHGAVIAACAFLAAGAERLAVTSVDEAVELRAARIEAPILLLASHAPDEAEAVVEQRLAATISDLGAAERLSAVAGDQTVPVHLLIDCGMGRDGCLPGDAPAQAAAVAALPGLDLDGVYTHFPTALSRDKSATRRQLGLFLETVKRLPARPRLVHAANSAAAVDLPESRLDLARIGTLLYGQYPSRWVSRAVQLRSAWRLCARLVEVRSLPAGATIGYGSEVRLRRATRVGTLLVGWSHGFTLQPASLARGLRGLAHALRPEPPAVTIAGADCPVLGRIAMQSCTVDLTAAPEARVGDIAEVPARRVTVPSSVVRVEVRS